MTGIANAGGERGWSGWRAIGWGAAISLLVLPAVAMRFTDEVNWTAGDFVFAGLLFGGVGLGIEFLVRQSANLSYRVGAVLALLAAFLNVWVNGAVGMIGSEDNPYNLLFIGVIALSAIGAAAARLRPAGISRAMLAAGAAHLAIAAGGALSDVRGAVLSMIIGSVWLGSAWLFGRAGKVEAA
jgi:hypothetical protein